ncbi:hypothetical protein INR49_029144 [Caranx melampygus]|nr:hypothetical protein INR49_029144 [Caranx melampygus]
MISEVKYENVYKEHDKGNQAWIDRASTNIIRDSSYPGHHLFTLPSSGWRHRPLAHNNIMEQSSCQPTSNHKLMSGADSVNQWPSGHNELMTSLPCGLSTSGFTKQFVFHIFKVIESSSTLCNLLGK